MTDFKVALTFGRFNLLHVGHVDLFRQMSAAAPEIIIGVSSHEKNLPFRDRTKVITQVLEKDEKIVSPYQVLSKRQPFELASELLMYKPEDCIFYLGQDQFELAKALERTWGVATRLIPRLTSSTTVRALIDAEEWSALSTIVPMTVLNKVVQMHLDSHA